MEAKRLVNQQNAKLRRICEMKPSGKIQVPKEVHDQWKLGGHGREQLLDVLVNKVNMDKASFGGDKNELFSTQ